MARHRIKRYGTRAEVMNGGARMTQGRLTKSDLKYNEYGYIVSKTKSIQMKGEKNPLRKFPHDNSLTVLMKIPSRSSLTEIPSRNAPHKKFPHDPHENPLTKTASRKLPHGASLTKTPARKFPGKNSLTEMPSRKLLHE